MEIYVCRLCLEANVKMYDLLSEPLKKYAEAIPTLINTTYLLHYACYKCAAILVKLSNFIDNCNKVQDVLCSLHKDYREITEETINQIDKQELNLKMRLEKNQTKPDSVIEITHFDEIFIKEDTDSNFVVLEEKELNLEELKEISDYDADGFDDDDNVPLASGLRNGEEIVLHDKGNRKIEKKTPSTKIKKKTKRKPTKKKKEKRSGEEKVKRNENGKSSKRKMAEQKILKCFDLVFLSLEEQIEEVQKRKETAQYEKSPYKCDICYKTHQKEESHKRHMMEHDPSFGPYECEVCKKRFRVETTHSRHLSCYHRKQYRCKMCPYVCKERQAPIHMSTHTSTVTFKCKHCDFNTQSFAAYYSHRRSHAWRADCVKCGRGFISVRGLNLHLIRAHQGEDEVQGSFPCQQCNVTFDNEPALEVHMTTSKKHVNKEKSKELKKNRQPCFYPRKCDYCTVSLPSRQSHWQHVRASHPAQRPLYRPAHSRALCHLCGRGFPCPASLRLHLSVHSPPSLPCPVQGCSSVFHHRYQLAAHHRHAHRNDHRHKCHVCGRAFSEKGNLTRHLRVHSGERPYPCPECGKRFTQGGSRALHLRTVHRRAPHPTRARKVLHATATD